jgi:hypothetical protein
MDILQKLKEKSPLACARTVDKSGSLLYSACLTECNERSVAMLFTRAQFFNAVSNTLSSYSKVIDATRMSEFVGAAVGSMRGYELTPSNNTMHIANLHFNGTNNAFGHAFGYTGNVQALTNTTNTAISYTAAELTTDAAALAKWMAAVSNAPLTVADALAKMPAVDNEAYQAALATYNGVRQTATETIDVANTKLAATLIGSTITYVLRLTELNVKNTIESHKILLESIAEARINGQAAIKETPTLQDSPPMRQLLSNIHTHTPNTQVLEECKASFVETSHAHHYVNNLAIYGPQLVIDLITESWATIAHVAVLLTKFAEDDWKANNKRDHAIHDLECTLGQVGTSSEALMAELLIWNKYVFKNELAVFNVLPQSQNPLFNIHEQTSYLFYSAASYDVTPQLSANWAAANASLAKIGSKSHTNLLNQPASSVWSLAMDTGAVLGYALEYTVNTALIAADGVVRGVPYGFNVAREAFYDLGQGASNLVAALPSWESAQNSKTDLLAWLDNLTTTYSATDEQKSHTESDTYDDACIHPNTGCGSVTAANGNTHDVQIEL